MENVSELLQMNLCYVHAFCAADIIWQYYAYIIIIIYSGSECFIDVFAVADIVKKCLNMTVWGLVRSLPVGDCRCASIDEYR